MRIRLLNLLLLLALVLAVSRLWLFLGEPPVALPPTGTGSARPAAEANAPEQDVEAAESRPEAYDVIVARDLFSPARGVVPPAPAAAARPAAKPVSAPKLTLYGVVILDGEKTAYLQEGTQETRPRKVRENENFAGGVLKTIRPDGVTFLFAGSEINVPLRTPKDTPGTPAARAAGSPVAPPRPEATVGAPRRLMPPNVQQGQVPIPGRPASPAQRMPAVAPPVESGGEVFEDEEFPEESQPGDDGSGTNEDEGGD